MLIEIGFVGGGYFISKKTIEYFKDRDLRKIKNIFNDVMTKANIHNTSTSKESYSIYGINRIKYGYFALIKIPNGLTFEKLESLKDVIQDNMKCLVEFKKDRYSNLVQTKFIYSPQDTREFQPMKTKSNELFLGYMQDGKPLKLNLNKDPHVLIAGKTGTGKSFLFASILANLIYNNKKDIEIYLFQIMKGEIDVFKNCPSVKFASDNSDEIFIMLEKLYKLMHTRSKQFTEYGIKNITQWNKHFSNRKMKRIIIGAEEVSFFMNAIDMAEKNNEKEKNPYFEYFTGIVKAGRSVGIHFICLTQRTTAKNLGGNGELKSQMCVITGQQKTKTDSENAIDVKDAVYLQQQEYIANTNDGYTWFKSPIIDEDYEILQQYVPKIITPKKIMEEKQKDTKKVCSKDNVLICEKSEWIPLDEYNKQKQQEIVKTIQSDPIPLKKTKRKNVIQLKGREDVANYQ